MNPKKINEKENAFLDSLCKRTNGFFWNYCVRSNDAGDVLLTSYNTNEPYCRLDEVEYFDQRSFRGKEFFASMPPEQISATAALVKHLCRKYSIPLKFKKLAISLAECSVVPSVTRAMAAIAVRGLLVYALPASKTKSIRMISTALEVKTSSGMPFFRECVAGLNASMSMPLALIWLDTGFCLRSGLSIMF